VSDQHVRQLHERLGLGGKEPRADDESAVVRGLGPAAGDLRGWDTVRLDARPDASPPSVHAFVRPSGEAADDIVFRVDTYELGSAAEAHEYMVRMLTEFQSPQLAVADHGIGDLAVGHADTAIVARRANIVFTVRNAGANIAPVLDVAEAIDNVIRQRVPEQGAAG
jgi:hypothetical protein